MSQPRWVWVAGAVVGAVVVGALVDDSDRTAPPATTVTTPIVGEATVTPTITPPAVQTGAPHQATGVAQVCTVPDVVGMIHQSAQDAMQAAGLYRLREEDATGQQRLLVVDRNWTTTSQSATAGQVLPCDTEITLWAKKTGE